MSLSTQTRCAAQPISWLELERHALGESQRPAQIDAHLAECAACEEVLAAIRGDQRSMPGLSVPIATQKRAGWRLPWRLSLVLAPLAIVLLVILVRPSDPSGSAGVKGAEPGFVLIREHASRLLAPTHFAAGDRFKARVTCAPTDELSMYVDLVVSQNGALYYPLPPTKIACGNQVPLPGAFSIDGPHNATVCLVLSTTGPPVRQSIPSGSLCIELAPGHT